MRRPGFHAVTLGCKLNQFDTAAIEGELRRRGLAHEPDARDAGVLVVNTCTVTGRADADARKRIRRLRRASPDALLLVTGCYAELDPASIDAMPEVDRVVGNVDKPRLPAILDELGLPPAEREPASGGDRGCDAAPRFGEALHFGERSRAFLKVQEGCRLACSYCVIPRVRGASRSVEPAVVERAASGLFARGFGEVVLTGVNTGDYGRDLEPRTTLAALLRRLLDGCGANRVRLNSLEPLTVTDGIVELLGGDPRLAPHLQIPLQSGCDATLAAMRRNYRTAAYLERLERLAEAVPSIGLGADVIVGFPGEDAARFERSLEFVERSPLSYLHVFSWSPRPGTPAAARGDRVDPREIRRRSSAMRELGALLARRFRARRAGELEDAVVLAEAPGAPEVTALRALTGNFIEVRLPRGSAARGELVRVRLGRERPDGTLPATPAGAPSWAPPARAGRTGHEPVRSGPSAPSPS